MKRLAVVVGALLAVALVPATASADFKSGKYRYASSKSTSCGLCTVSFKASQSKGSKLRFSLDIPSSTPVCSGGQGFKASESDFKTLFGSPKTSITDAKFKFSREATNSAGSKFKVTVKGKLKNSSAKGTLRLTAEYVTGTTCDTGRLSFKAKRKT
jgi:hypothetical protein